VGLGSRRSGDDDYDVIAKYQCPNRKCWHEVGEVVSLLPCEAEYLLLGGKVARVAVASVEVEGE